MGSERDPDSSLSCSPFIDNLHNALKIRNASLCMIEGNAIDVVTAGGVSLTTTASSTCPAGAVGFSLLLTDSSTLAAGLLISTLSVTLSVRTASVTVLINGMNEKDDKERL